MADRLLALLALFIRNDLISKSDLERSYFPNEGVLDTLRELLDSVNDALTEDQTDEELVEWVDEYENQESTRKNELEDLVRELKTATEKLIEEYNASQATEDDLT